MASKNPIELLNIIAFDGSRHFLALPETKSAHYLLLLIFKLWGAYPTACVSGFLEFWIDFRYKGQKFSINNQYGEIWFFVADSSCPEALLCKVAKHFDRHLSLQKMP